MEIVIQLSKCKSCGYYGIKLDVPDNATEEWWAYESLQHDSSCKWLITRDFSIEGEDCIYRMADEND